MEGELFGLRHVSSGLALTNGCGPLVFGTAAVATAFAARFGCEFGGFKVQAAEGTTEGVTDAATAFASSTGNGCSRSSPAD
jgi:hypothetical protein